MARMSSLRPVHRIKHVVDLQGALTVGTQGEEFVAKAVDAPVLANTTEVETGAKINGIYLKVEAYATSAAALSNLYMFLYKNPGGNITAPQANGVGSDDNKRFVIHQEMVMLQQVDKGNPRTVFNGVIVIPKGMRRMGPNDYWGLALKSPGVTVNFCFQAHYKEFR